MKEKNFEIKVAGVGKFGIRTRTMSDELEIAAGYSEITRGQDKPSLFLVNLATMVATLRVVIQTAPESWDVDTLDPMDEASYAQMRSVYDAIVGAEYSFRKGPGTQGEAQGASTGGRPGAVDQAPVQPGTD